MRFDPGKVGLIDVAICVDVLAEITRISFLPAIDLGLMGVDLVDHAVAVNIAEQQARRHGRGGESVSLVIVDICHGKSEILFVTVNSSKANEKAMVVVGIDPAALDCSTLGCDVIDGNDRIIECKS